MPQESTPFTDPVYGETVVSTPLLQELLETDAVQRLKNVSQFGIPNTYYHRENFSRYDHSLGTCLLLKRFDTATVTQAAGLLHDVSHLAFSHVADWVLGHATTEDYHDRIHEQFLHDTDIPQVLNQYGYTLSDITPETHGLVEREKPALCADRIDYALREFHAWYNPDLAQSCLPALTVDENQFIFTSQQAAEQFAHGFLTLQQRHWAAPETMVRYHVFSTVLSTALKHDIITEEDLFQDEAVAMNKLRSASHPVIATGLQQLRTGIEFDIVEGADEADICLRKKLRYVDPLYEKREGTRERVSAASEDFVNAVAAAREQAENGVHLTLPETLQRPPFTDS